MARVFFFILVSLGLFLFTKCQLLNGAVESVTTFQTCTESPLNAPPFNTANAGTNSTPPCGQLMGQNVTEVVLNVFPNRATGADNFVFQVNHVLPPGNTGTYTDGQTCSGVAVGANCTVLAQPLVITISSTALYAAYKLLQRKYSIPYTYFLYISDDDSLDRDDNPSPYAVFTTDSIDQSSPVVNSYVQLTRTTLPGQDILCPGPGTAGAPNSSVSPYYTPPSLGNFVTGSVTILYCRRAQPPGPGTGLFQDQIIKQVNPLCSVFDILERPSGLMNINLTASVNGQNITVTLSSANGGQLAVIPGVLYARINTLNLGTTLIGDTIPGLIVTCNTCNASLPNCVLGKVNDMPTTDPYQIYNPWDKVTSSTIKDNRRCTMPAAKCRELFNGQPAGAFWYYVPPQNVAQYGVNCNQNGMPETIYNSPDIAQQVCAIVSQCPYEKGVANPPCTSLPAKCVPGYEATGSNTEDLGDATAFTPCQVSLLQAHQIYDQIQATDANQVPGFTFMPDNYNQQDPNIWMNSDQLLTESFGGNTPDVSISLSLYVAGSFLGEVQTFSPGIFSSVGQSCTGDQGSDGAVAFSVQNTGTLPGTYLVTVQFILPPGGLPVDLTVAAPTISGPITGSTTANNIAYTTIQVGAGLIASSAFDYTYTGPTGDAMTALLTLAIPTPGLGDTPTQILAQQNVTCTIVSGEHIITSGGDHVSTMPSSPLSTNCPWWGIFKCWGQVPFWALFIRAILFLMLIFSTIFFVVYLILATYREVKLNSALSKDEKINKERQQIADQEPSQPKPEEIPQGEMPRQQGSVKFRGIQIMVVMICCVVATGNCQQILSVSSFQACLSTAVTGITLNCSNAGGISTVLDVRVTPTTGNVTEAFLVELSVIPPNSEAVQQQTSNQCQIPTTDGRCQTTEGLTTITIEMSKPVLQYSLRPAVGRSRNPFKVPYSYYYVLDIQPTNVSPTQTCTVLGTESVRAPSEPPTNQTLFQIFTNTMNNQYIRCPSNAPVPFLGASSSTTTNILRYYFDCGGTTVTVSESFYELAPLCTVYEIENPPDVLAHVDITATNKFGTQNVFLESIGQGASAASQTAEIIARIENVQSPTGKHRSLTSWVL